MQGTVQHSPGHCIQVCGCKITYSAVGLHGFAYQSSNDAVRCTEVKASFERNRLCQISSRGKPTRQACRSHRGIEAQSIQHSRHEDCYPASCFQRMRYITVGKDAIVYLARRCAAECSRSEEHTSELQSPCNLVCRLLLEKKKNNI